MFDEVIKFQTYMKISKKTKFNQRTSHNQPSYLSYWYTTMCKLIRQTICKKLAKIKYFRHAFSSIACMKIPKTRDKIMRFLWKFDENMCYQTQIGQCCRPVRKNSLKNQKSSDLSITLEEIRYFENQPFGHFCNFCPKIQFGFFTIRPFAIRPFYTSVISNFNR